MYATVIQWSPWDQHFFAVSDRWLLYTGHFAKISTTGSRSSGRNKKEVAVFNMQWPL